MNINEISSKYKQLRVISAISPNVESDLIELFNIVKDNMFELIKQPIDDSFAVSLLFHEMTIRKIGDLSPYCSYYMGTMCQTSNIPQEQKRNTLRFKLIALFKNLDAFDRLISLAHLAPIAEYEGSLSDEEFFDFLIMSDAYKIWDANTDDRVLSSIQRLVTQHEANHPRFSKQDIIKEGEKAHKALMNAVKMALGID